MHQKELAKNQEPEISTTTTRKRWRSTSGIRNSRDAQSSVMLLILMNWAE